MSRFCPTLARPSLADHSIFFLDGKIRECKNIAATLNQYCFALGQTINLNKYEIYFSMRRPSNLRRIIAHELQVPGPTCSLCQQHTKTAEHLRLDESSVDRPRTRHKDLGSSPNSLEHMETQKQTLSSQSKDQIGGI